MPSVPKVTTSLFADDTMFYSANNNKNYAILKLQQQMDLIIHWLDLWRLKLNAKKTTAIIFGSNSQTIRRELVIQGHTVEWSKTAKYLGVTLDRSLTFSDHVKNTI